ncbi:MAG: sodium/proline symporter [Proteobacteria bacterium]|nr:sodium/proline symporter [Pseudomonadota bacterium]
MEAFGQQIILGSVAVYLVLCIAIGVWAMGRTKSASDFFVAGRSLGPAVVGLAIFSSTMSGFGFVGGPGLVYSTGISSLWMCLTSPLGFALGFYLVAKRIRIMAEVRDTLSLPDIVAARYDSEAARLLMAITIILGVMGYLATQILAMAIVLKVLLGGTAMFADISLITCALVSTSVLLFYSVTGGIIASVYTDLIQGAVMIIAGALVFITAISVFDGGMQEASSILFADDPETIMPFGTAGAITCIGWFFMFGVGLAGQPHVITKMMMNKNISDNRTILPLSVLGYVMAALLWVSVGLIMRSVVVAGMEDPLTAPDQAAAAFLTVFAHPLLAGVVFAGLFAAIMSTADSFLNIGAAAMIHDIPIAIRGRPLNNELLMARWATVGLCVLAIAFALYSYYINNRLVALLGAFGWGTFAAAIVPVVMLGLNWQRATKQAAVAAVTSSLLINFIVEISAINIPYGMPGGFLALVASMIIFIVVSLLTPEAVLKPDIRAAMEI